MKKIVLLVVLSLVCVSVFGGGINEETTVTSEETTFIKKQTTVTIKNIDSMSRAGVWVFEELPVGSTNTALRSTFINKNTLTVNLVFPNKDRGNTWNSTKPWQGEGDFYIAIVPIVNDRYQEQNAMIYIGNGNEPIKYSFKNDELVTLSFSEFRRINSAEFGHSYSEPVPDIITNENELASIQGTWRSYNKRATYTFTGDQFTVTATDGRDPISGNVKISGGKLCLIVSDELFGLYNYEFRNKNRIYLNELYGHPNSWWGLFIKQ
jgi:hypothetical protein